MVQGSALFFIRPLALGAVIRQTGLSGRGKGGRESCEGGGTVVALWEGAASTRPRGETPPRKGGGGDQAPPALRAVVLSPCPLGERYDVHPPHGDSGPGSEMLQGTGRPPPRPSIRSQRWWLHVLPRMPPASAPPEAGKPPGGGGACQSRDVGSQEVLGRLRLASPVPHPPGHTRASCYEVTTLGTAPPLLRAGAEAPAVPTSGMSSAF